MLSVKNGSKEDQILAFVADFVNFRLTKETGDTGKCFTRLPSLKIDEKDHIAGLSSIIRYLAQTSGNQSLLGCKGSSLKAPAEFSSQTNLIENLLPSILERTETGSIDFEPFKQLEALLRGPIVQHNLDKYQRMLIKREDRAKVAEKRGNDGRLINPPKPKIPAQNLPELEHAFFQGIKLSICDLAAFVPVDKFLQSRWPLSDDDMISYQAIINWYSRMKTILKMKNISYKTADISKYVENTDEVENDLIVLRRRYTAVGDKSFLEVINQQMDNGNFQLRHAKSTKTTVQSLELTSKRDLKALLSTFPVKVESIELDSTELEQIEFIGSAKPLEGGLGKERAERKEAQLKNMIKTVIDMSRDGDKIVDFCSGGGHLGLAVASLLPKCEIFLVENKHESLRRARTRIEEGKIPNVTLVQTNMSQWNSKFDIGLALHACGSATDQVVKMCMDFNASFAISPCCYGRVSKLDLPRSKTFSNFLSSQEALLLAHAADITPWDKESSKTGKECMNLTDWDRKLKCEEDGYKVKLYSMNPYSCTPKNNFIVGIKRIDL